MNVVAVMLALWHSRGKIRCGRQYILGDVNASCSNAFSSAARLDLARRLRVDEANRKLGPQMRRVATILERPNVTVLTADHDCLGYLHEKFFSTRMEIR